jgi:RNA polymerase sigma-70 factor (ECF subfamily)
MTVRANLAPAPQSRTAPARGHGPPAREAGEDTVDDWTLVRTAQGGDSDAFAALYSRHVQAIYRYLRIQVRDPGLAEDITSETFLRALRGLHRVHRRDVPFSAWLFTIAGNLLRDHHRWLARHPHDEHGPPEVPDAAAGPEERALAATDPARSALARCLPQLGTDQRTCLYLRFIAGLSVAETAATMHRTHQGLRALQYRSIRRLAELMPARDGDGLADRAPSRAVPGAALTDSDFSAPTAA